MEENNKYQRGKIYTIRHPDSEKYYIGSTCEPYLSRRFGKHKIDYKRYLNDKSHNVSSYRLFELGLNECYIELLELYPCNSKEQLNKREGELIRLYKNDIVNKNIPCRTKKQWYEVNKEKISEQTKERYESNKEQISERTKVKYTCDCGSILRKNDKSRHERTLKHIEFINAKKLSKKSKKSIKIII